MKRNICSACENCVFNSRDIAWCGNHCEIAQNVLADVEYQRNNKYFHPAEELDDPLPFE